MSASHRASDVIASGIHDSKNMLFQAIGRIERIGANAAPNVDRHDIAEAEAFIRKAADRLNKMLAAYRLIRHENPVCMLPVILSDLIEDVMAQVSLTNRTEVLVSSSVCYDGAWVLDRDLIEDSLRNMVDNAVRHAKSFVLISVTQQNGGLVLAVEDDGPGFDPKNLPDDDDDGQHSGLGLFITKKIAALHENAGVRGRFSVSKSEDFGGAKVVIELP